MLQARGARLRRVSPNGCEDTATWLCPGWAERAATDESGHEIAPVDPHYLSIAHCSDEAHKCGRADHPPECQTAEYQNCLETHCCTNRGYRCFEKKGPYYAQCLPRHRCIPDNGTVYPDGHVGDFICNDVTGLTINSPARRRRLLATRRA